MSILLVELTGLDRVDVELGEWEGSRIVVRAVAGSARLQVWKRHYRGDACFRCGWKDSTENHSSGHLGG